MNKEKENTMISRRDSEPIIWITDENSVVKENTMNYNMVTKTDKTNANLSTKQNHCNHEDCELLCSYTGNMESSEFRRSSTGDLSNVDCSAFLRVGDFNDKTSLSMSDVSKNEIYSEQEKGRWEELNTLLVYTSVGVKARNKIAAFDIDGTVICTVSGGIHPTSPLDWRFNFREIPEVLQNVFADGYKVVFFTNQAGIGKGKVDVQGYKNKIEDIVAKLETPIQVFISTRGDGYMKPRLGMLQHLIKQGNDDIAIDVGQSFFVGDNAGRPKGWLKGKPKDISCSDRLFAINAGMAFYTPEEYFLGQKKAIFQLPTFDPRVPRSTDPLCDPTTAQLVAPSTEMIVMVGCPASGKSFFVNHHLTPHGYESITEHTWQEGVTKSIKALKMGRRIVIDNRNPDRATRKRYIECAGKLGVTCRCFMMTTKEAHAKHNERFRLLMRRTTGASPPSSPVCDFGVYRCNFQVPYTSEGFSEMVQINCVPYFTDKDMEAHYRLYSSKGF